jgi:hypothetical protein
MSLVVTDQHSMRNPLAVARIAMSQPVNGIAEIGGPEQFSVDELVRRRLTFFMGAL